MLSRRQHVGIIAGPRQDSRARPSQAAKAAPFRSMPARAGGGKPSAEPPEVGPQREADHEPDRHAAVELSPPAAHVVVVVVRGPLPHPPSMAGPAGGGKPSG